MKQKQGLIIGILVITLIVLGIVFSDRVQYPNTILGQDYHNNPIPLQEFFQDILEESNERISRKMKPEIIKECSILLAEEYGALPASLTDEQRSDMLASILDAKKAYLLKRWLDGDKIFID